MCQNPPGGQGPQDSCQDAGGVAQAQQYTRVPANERDTPKNEPKHMLAHVSRCSTTVTAACMQVFADNGIGLPATDGMQHDLVQAQCSDQTNHASNQPTNQPRCNVLVVGVEP
jgi:hypothetical protein